MRALALCVALFAPGSAFAVSPLGTAQAEMLQEGLIETADAFILPTYTAQAEAAGALVTHARAHCDGDGGAERAQQAFVATLLAWQRASLIDVGPVKAAEGAMRIQFWPDPKGFARRAVRAALQAEDPALLAPGGLEGRSIALTNLTALERLLFPPPEPESYACALAVAIATFQADLAADLAADWMPGSAYRTLYDTAATGNAAYGDVTALMRELLAGAVVHVDRLRKFKIERGLGAAPGEARPERTEARASGAGLASIEASFRGLADFYAVPYGLFDMAPEIGGSMDYIVLEDTARSAADALAIQEATLAEIAAEDGVAAAELRRIADLALFHEAFLKTGFLEAIGLSAGFTAADGD